MLQKFFDYGRVLALWPARAETAGRVLGCFFVFFLAGPDRVLGSKDRAVGRAGSGPGFRDSHISAIFDNFFLNGLFYF